MKISLPSIDRETKDLIKSIVSLFIGFAIAGSAAMFGGYLMMAFLSLFI